jgi:ferrochelatase
MIGVLLTNLGTPDAPTASAVRRYLTEFLSDSRVVEIPQFLWRPILHGIVLRFRPQRSAKLYQKIWMSEGSPLLVHSQRLAQKIQQELNAKFNKPVTVVLGMRYGNPSIPQALAELQQKNIQQLLVLPLYPQYSAATVGSTFDAVANVIKKWRCVPDLQFISNYYDDANYIAAVGNSIRRHWQQHGQNSHLLFSFHGLPKRCIDLGDPYQQQCQITAKLIADNLQLPQENWSMAFQSRFGRAEWLQPYCDKTLRELPKQGRKNIAVICPGFAVDCLETLEEIAMQNREIFLQAGGKHFAYIPALNDSDDQIRVLLELIAKKLS